MLKLFLFLAVSKVQPRTIFGEEDLERIRAMQSYSVPNRQTLNGRREQRQEACDIFKDMLQTCNRLNLQAVFEVEWEQLDDGKSITRWKQMTLDTGDILYQRDVEMDVYDEMKRIAQEILRNDTLPRAWPEFWGVGTHDLKDKFGMKRINRPKQKCIFPCLCSFASCLKTYVTNLLRMMFSPPKKLNIEGFIAATYTPYDRASGNINLSLIKPYAAHLAKQKVKAIFVNGTTGESVLLSIAERKAIIGEWMKVAAKYNFKVIAMVATNSTKDSQDLAIHAASTGVDAISCMSPSFFKPSSMDSLVSYLKPIADSAPNIPFYYYHMPSMTNLYGRQQSEWNMFDFIKYIDENQLIPNFVGLKYTGMYGTFLSFSDIMNIIAYKNGKYEVFGGRDEMVLQLLCSGVKGFVGLSYNFAADLYYSMMHAFEQRNIEKCRDLQRMSHRLIEIGINGNDWGHKYIFRLLSDLDFGDARPPNIKLTDNDKIRIKRKLSAWNKKYGLLNDAILSKL